MRKPTAKRLSEIIEFVINQPKIAEAISKRDSHPEVMGTHVSCRFYKQHNSDLNRSAYDVVFGYYTKNDELDKSDDIAVRVEVIDGTSPTFKVLGVKTD